MRNAVVAVVMARSDVCFCWKTIIKSVHLNSTSSIECSMLCPFFRIDMKHVCNCHWRTCSLFYINVFFLSKRISVNRFPSLAYSKIKHYTTQSTIKSWESRVVKQFADYSKSTCTISPYLNIICIHLLNI